MSWTTLIVLYLFSRPEVNSLLLNGSGTEELTTDRIKQDNSEIYHLSSSTTESDINISSINISELLGRHAIRENNQTRFYKDVNQPHKDLQVTSKLKNTFLELEKVPWNFNADYQQSLQVLEQTSDWDYYPHPLYHPYQLKPPEPSNRPFILNPTDESPYPPNRSPLNKLSALPPTPTLVQTKHPIRSFPHYNPPKPTYTYLPYNMMMTHNKFKPPNQIYPTNLYKPRRSPALKHPWDIPPSVPYPPIKRDILSPPFSPTAPYHDSSLNTDGIFYLPEYPYPLDPNDVNIPDRTRNLGFHGTIPKPCQVYPQPIWVFLPNPVLQQIFPVSPYTLSLLMAKPAPPTPPPPPPPPPPPALPPPPPQLPPLPIPPQINPNTLSNLSYTYSPDYPLYKLNPPELLKPMDPDNWFNPFRSSNPKNPANLNYSSNSSIQYNSSNPFNPSNPYNSSQISDLSNPSNINIPSDPSNPYNSSNPSNPNNAYNPSDRYNTSNPSKHSFEPNPLSVPNPRVDQT